MHSGSFGGRFAVRCSYAKSDIRVENYLASLAQRTDDNDGYYVEISGVDSIIGNPIRVEWKPMSDKMRA